jgi:hypothetical protein
MEDSFNDAAAGEGRPASCLPIHAGLPGGSQSAALTCQNAGGAANPTWRPNFFWPRRLPTAFAPLIADTNSR